MFLRKCSDRSIIILSWAFFLSKWHLHRVFWSADMKTIVVNANPTILLTSFELHIKLYRTTNLQICIPCHLQIKNLIHHAVYVNNWSKFCLLTCWQYFKCNWISSCTFLITPEVVFRVHLQFLDTFFPEKQL